MELELEWKVIPGFPEYEVSNHGQVRNIAEGKGRTVGRVLRPRAGDLGHLSVCLCRDGQSKMMQVHRLVALTFIGDQPPDRPVVAHGDGVSSNNRLDNLRWATNSENEQDKVLHGKSNRGERHGNSQLTEEMIKTVREMASIYCTSHEIATVVPTSPRNIRLIVSGKRWNHIR